MSAAIVLTGATGFLGRAVVAELLGPRCGRDARAPGGSAGVTALCRRPAPELEQLGIRVAIGSLLDADWLRSQIPEGATIVHMAGKVEFTAEGIREMHDLHVEATRCVARAALARKARLVLASSSGTTAISRHERVVDETAPYPMELVSRWPYYLTKTLAERLVLDLHLQERLEAVVLNPSLLLGPGDDRGGSTSVVADYLEGRIPVVPGGGISVVDVRDAAAALVAAIDRGEPGERYFLAGHNCRFATFFAVLDMVSGRRRSMVGLPGKLAIAGSHALHRLRKGDSVHPVMVEMAQHFWYADPAKAARQLGFKARPLEGTLRDTIAYWHRSETAPFQPAPV